MTIRQRTDADLPGLVGALRLLHQSDSYPIHWPDDPASFLSSARQLRAWVALVGEGAGAEIIGHVAVKRAARLEADRLGDAPFPAR